MIQTLCKYQPFESERNVHERLELQRASFSFLKNENISIINPLWTENFKCFSGVAGTWTTHHTTMWHLYKQYIVGKGISSTF